VSVNVLFVCLGNICRSPTAHAVFQHLVETRGFSDAVRVDSAGTGDWHIGLPPDTRASASAALRGYDLTPLRARQVEPGDFRAFDYILAMDAQNLRNLRALLPADFGGELRLFMHYATGVDEREVPDPYYGGENDFDRVLDLVENAAQGLLDTLVVRHGLRAQSR